MPLGGVTLILGVDELMDMARTMTNVIGNCLATAIIARWEGPLSDTPTLDAQPLPRQSETVGV